MKSNIFIYIVTILILSSCEGFLDENNKAGRTEQNVYTNEKAIDALVASCYSYTRMWYGKEGGFGLSEGGTDLWYNAADNKQSDLVTYKNVTPDPASDNANNNSCLDEYWEAFSAAINLCNTAEQQIKQASFINNAKKKTLLSEVYFLRAFYYWHMVETWGPVPLVLEPITKVNTQPVRNSVDQVYTQMFKDVQFAIDSLAPGTPSSRVTHWAARSLKARLALYYASEYGKTEYYPIAANEAKAVIASSGKSFYDKYDDVWDIKNSSTSKNKEFIWAVDYYDIIGDAQSFNFLPPRMKTGDDGITPLDWSSIIVRRTPANASGGGNIMHVVCTPLWYSQTDKNGGASLADVLTRYVGSQKYYTVASPSDKVSVDVGNFYVKYGMGYTRYAPTRYCLNLFDETKDQRYNGTFRTAWYKHPDIVPKDYGKPACLYPNMKDTALFWSKRALTPSQRAWATGRYKVFDVTWTFLSDGVTPNTTSGNSYADRMYAMLRKWENTDSKIAASTSFQDYFSYKDFPVFRISEMYLIAAEALMSSDQPQAVTLVNALRAKRAITGQNMDVASVDLNFILEERGREFTGENIRWFDLKRTKKLQSQIVNNTKASSYFQPKHYLRPIPSTQMNAVSNRTTGPAEGGFWQNEGY